MAADLRRASIARLNDHLRFTGEGGWTYLSRGVAALPIARKDAVILGRVDKVDSQTA